MPLAWGACNSATYTEKGKNAIKNHGQREVCDIKKLKSQTSLCPTVFIAFSAPCLRGRQAIFGIQLYMYSVKTAYTSIYTAVYVPRVGRTYSCKSATYRE